MRQQTKSLLHGERKEPPPKHQKPDPPTVIGCADCGMTMEASKAATHKCTKARP